MRLYEHKGKSKDTVIHVALTEEKSKSYLATEQNKNKQCHEHFYGLKACLS